ncbi:MAG: SDR family oxidoreductase [Jiangellaceae bacterium]
MSATSTPGSALAVLDVQGKVALVTGAARGIGAAMACRLAERGAQVVVADVDDVAAADVARHSGGTAIHCDVRDLADNQAAVARAVQAYGGLDMAVLNAGVPGTGLVDGLDLEAYSTAVAVNLDGVVFGVAAALPPLRARGGGDVVVTASLAGLTPVASDPVYTATKHAVVGLVRSLAPAVEADGIRVNALCPGWADTAIVDRIRANLQEQGHPLLAVDDVVDALAALLGAGRSGECWWVQPGRPAAPYEFRGVPGPRPAATSEGGAA